MWTWRSPRTSPSSSRSGGGVGASSSRSSGGGSAVSRELSLQLASPLRRADRANELALPALRRRADHLDRVAVRRDADDPPLVALQHGDELRHRLGLGEALQRDDDGEVRRELAGPPRIARRLAAECRRHLADEGERAVQRHPAPRPGRRELRQSLLDPRRRLRPDPGDAAEPALGRGLAQLRQRPDPERVAELAHPLRRDAEQRRDADELGQRLRLELVQLGDARPSRRAPAAAPRCPARFRPAPAPVPAARVRTRRPASSGSDRPRGGTHARCSGRSRSGRGGPRRPRGARQGLRCPRLESCPMAQIVVPFRGEDGKRRLDAPEEARSAARAGDARRRARGGDRDRPDARRHRRQGRPRAGRRARRRAGRGRARRAGRRGRGRARAPRRRTRARRQRRPAMRRPARPADARRSAPSSARSATSRPRTGRRTRSRCPSRSTSRRSTVAAAPPASATMPTASACRRSPARSRISATTSTRSTTCDRIGLRAGPRTQAAIGRVLQP